MDEINRFINVIKKHYPKLDFHIIIIHEFADEKVDSLEKEYVELSNKQPLYTIYSVHMKEQQQAIFPSSDKFYDTVFKPYIAKK